MQVGDTVQLIKYNPNGDWNVLARDSYTLGGFYTIDVISNSPPYGTTCVYVTGSPIWLTPDYFKVVEPMHQPTIDLTNKILDI